MMTPRVPDMSRGVLLFILGFKIWATSVGGLQKQLENVESLLLAIATLRSRHAIVAT